MDTVVRTAPLDTRDDALSAIEDEVGTLVRRVRRALQERAEAVHAEISVPAYLLMSRLAWGPCRSADLAEEVGIDKGAISRQVHQLLDLGLVVRTPDPDDGRAQRLELTGEGNRRLQRMTVERRTILDGRLGDWSTAELRALADGLGRYNRSLEA